MSSPADLILERNRAFVDGDFGVVFDTYHSESNFRRQFESRDEYVLLGQTSLSQDFKIVNCKILGEVVDGVQAQVVFLMEMQAQGQLQSYAELSWLELENGEWRYQRGLKMTQEELPEDPEKLTFADFAKLDHSTIF